MNTYDEMYNIAAEQILVRGAKQYNSNSKLTQKTIDFCNTHFNSHHYWLPTARSSKLSDLMKNVEYVSFLKKAKMHKECDIIASKWRTGGIEGGSCWDDGTEDVHRSSGGEERPENALTDILTAVAPNITFLQFKTLEKNLIKKHSYTEYEYYGNSTDYAVEYFSMWDLFNELKAMGHV